MDSPLPDAAPPIAALASACARQFPDTPTSFAVDCAAFQPALDRLLTAVAASDGRYAFDREGRPQALVAVRRALPAMEAELFDAILEDVACELAAVQGPKVAPERLAAGDLVFFGSRGNVSHVGIYVGEGRFVHAPSTGGTVRLDTLDGPYWRDHYTGAKRVLH